MADASSLDSTHPYTLRGVTQMLGLTRHAVGRLVELGFVQPVRSGRALRFSFRDVVLLRTAQEPKEDAQQMYERAEALEAADPAAAQALYRRVIEASPDHADAYANLGFLMCESHRYEEAAKLYAEAVRHCPQAPLLHYNRGVALEALGHVQEAVKSYETCLRLAPDMADAHQNAALLYARAGDKHSAIRHFSAYRRLQPRG